MSSKSIISRGATPPRVAVVGAGWAGLACALALVKAGAHVDLFEAARVAGGRARSVVRQEQVFDNGQHILIGAYSSCIALFEELGLLQEALMRIPLTLEVPGKFRFCTPRLPAPWHIVAGVVTASGLGAADKLALLRWMITRKLQGFRAPEHETVATWCADLPASVQRWMIDPLCLSALNTPSSAASASSFAAVLRDSLGSNRKASDLLIPAVDLGALLPSRALESLHSHGARVHLGCSVQALKKNADRGWQLQIAPGIATSKLADASDAVFDNVVLATPPWVTRTLLSELNDSTVADLIATLDALRYEPITTVYLKPKRHVTMLQPMFALEYDPEQHAHGQFLFDRTRCGGPPNWLAVVISAASTSSDLDAPALAAACARQVAETLGQTIELEDFWIVTEKRATFACTPGLKRPEAQVPVKGLFLAGDYTRGEYPATLEQAVRSGETAAQSTLLNWGLRSK